MGSRYDFRLTENVHGSLAIVQKNPNFECIFGLMKAKEFVSLWVYKVNCLGCSSDGQLRLKTESFITEIRPYWKATITGDKARIESSVFPDNCLSAFGTLVACNDSPFQRYDISTNANGLTFLTNTLSKVRYLVVTGPQTIHSWVKGVPEMYGP